MFRKFALTLALALLPAAALAQEHQHTGAAGAAKPQMDHAQMQQRHEAMVQFIMSKRADLQLTDSQVTKLEQFAKDLATHHKMENAGHDAHAAHGANAQAMKPDSAMHNAFMGIFTEAQKAKVHALMMQHMQCATNDDKVCKP